MKLIPIAFYVDNITLFPRRAGGIPFAGQYVDHEVSLAYFADGQPASLYEVEGKSEYLFRRADGAWIQGPEC